MGKKRNGTGRHGRESSLKTPPKRSLVVTPGGVLAFVGLVVALLIFWPRVTVEFADPVDAANPLSSKVTITNATFMVPLETVTVAMGVCQLATDPLEIDPGYPCNTSKVASIVPLNWSHHYLAADEAYGISFAEVFGAPPNGRITGADVSAIVTYQWWFVPIQCRTTRRFVTRRQGDGKLHWFPQPIDESSR
jgi:hypothetical protein